MSGGTEYPIAPIAKRVAFCILLITISACQKHTIITDSHGRQIDINNLNGKWLVVNYWATWCHNCTQEMQTFDELYKQHKKKLIVLGVNFDELPSEKLNTLQKKYKIHYPLASHFPIKNYGIDHIDNIPRTYIFSPNGKLHKTLYGPQPLSTLEKEIS